MMNQFESMTDALGDLRALCCDPDTTWAQVQALLFDACVDASDWDFAYGLLCQWGNEGSKWFVQWVDAIQFAFTNIADRPSVAHVIRDRKAPTMSDFFLAVYDECMASLVQDLRCTREECESICELLRADVGEHLYHDTLCDVTKVAYGDLPLEVLSNAYLWRTLEHPETGEEYDYFYSGKESLYTGGNAAYFYTGGNAAYYCNAGDTYIPTLVYDVERQQYRVISWGDMQQEVEERAWEYHLTTNEATRDVPWLVWDRFAKEGSFMQPEVEQGAWWIVDTRHDGGRCIQSYEVGIAPPEDENDPDEDHVYDMATFLGIEPEEIESLEYLPLAYGVRMQAPGFMDSTEWHVESTYAEAWEYLVENHLDMDGE